MGTPQSGAKTSPGVFWDSAEMTRGSQTHAGLCPEVHTHGGEEWGGLQGALATALSRLTSQASLLCSPVAGGVFV